jgi:hypothetical protein
MSILESLIFPERNYKGVQLRRLVELSKFSNPAGRLQLEEAWI